MPRHWELNLLMSARQLCIDEGVSPEVDSFKGLSWHTDVIQRNSPVIADNVNKPFNFQWQERPWDKNNNFLTRHLKPDPTSTQDIRVTPRFNPICGNKVKLKRPFRILIPWFVPCQCQRYKLGQTKKCNVCRYCLEKSNFLDEIDFAGGVDLTALQ